MLILTHTYVRPLEKQTIDSIVYRSRNKPGPWIYQKGKNRVLY